MKQQSKTRRIRFTNDYSCELEFFIDGSFTLKTFFNEEPVLHIKGIKITPDFELVGEVNPNYYNKLDGFYSLMGVPVLGSRFTMS